MKLYLGPDPGVGRTWHLHLELGDDVALETSFGHIDQFDYDGGFRRSLGRDPDTLADALKAARTAAASLGLTKEHRRDEMHWEWSKP